MNYIYAKTACPKTNCFPRYKPKSAQNGRKRDFLGYISKCSDQGFIKALWFSELSMGVIVASFCCKRHTFKSSRFGVIPFARGSKWPEI